MRWLIGFIFGIFRWRDRRRVFRFWDGDQWRSIDPLPAWRALFNDPNLDLAEDFGVFTDQEEKYTVEQQSEAGSRIIASARRAFIMPVYDGKHGATESDCYGAVLRLGDWMDRVKKNTSPQPT
jgi:hypothetical protein